MLGWPSPTATRSMPTTPAVTFSRGLIQYYPLSRRNFPHPPWHPHPLFPPHLQHSQWQPLQQLRTSRMLHAPLNRLALNLGKCVVTLHDSTLCALARCATSIAWKLEAVRERKHTWRKPRLPWQESSEWQCHPLTCRCHPPRCHRQLPPPCIQQLQWTCLQTHDMRCR
jgi:hypothetical protein